MTQQQLALASKARRIEHALGWHLEDLSDFELRLVVTGRVISKKTSPKVIRIGGRYSIAPSTEYQHWERAAHDALEDQWRAVFREPIPLHIEINLQVVAYLPDRRGWPDLLGILEGPSDVLEAHRPKCDLTVGVRTKRTKCRRHAGVIVNDRQVCDYAGSDRRINKDNPRVELTLTPYRRMT